jgi:hypothetical protein
MRYYLCSEISISNIKNKLSHMVFNETTEYVLLSPHGIYKYLGDDMFIHKICDENILENYIDGHTFLSGVEWEAKEVRHRIPLNTHKMEIHTYTFTPNLNSTLKFVVEFYDNGKVDYYFSSPDEPSCNILVDNIRSFLNAIT